MSHILASSWNDLPSKICWLLVGKNSRVNHSEVKEGLLREIHSIDRVWAVSEGKRPRVWGFQFL